APGVRSALKASATLRFLPLLCWIFRPVPNRIRTTIMVTTVPVFCDTVLVRLQPVRNADLTMKKLKTAVFGTGFMGRVHTEGIRRLGHVEVAAVAASRDEKARKFGDDVGIARTTGDYRTLLNDREIDAVHICTPNALHFPMAKAAMEAGKHVLCEKPLAVSVSEGKKLVELAKKQNLANCTF